MSEQSHQEIIQFILEKIKSDAAAQTFERQKKIDPVNPTEIPPDVLAWLHADELGKTAKRYLRKWGLRTDIGQAIVEYFDVYLKQKSSIFPRKWMYKYKWTIELIKIPTFMDYINAVHDSNREFKKDALEKMLKPLASFCTEEICWYKSIIERNGEIMKKVNTVDIMQSKRFNSCLSLHVGDGNHDKWAARQIGCHPRTVRNYRRALINVGLYKVVGKVKNFKPGHNPEIFTDGIHGHINERWVKQTCITEAERHKLKDLRKYVKGFGHSENGKKN
jgi:hypothetical protein